MKHRYIVILTLMVSALLLGACAKMAQPESAAVEFAAAPMEVMVAEGDAMAFDDAVRSTNLQPIEPMPQDRLVIRNANLDLVVPDPAESAERISQIAEEMGGFVVSMNIFQTTFGEGVSANQGNISIRVPADRLNEALELVKSEAIEIRMESISGQDVTQEYTDLQSQLKNLEAAEEELREIMGSLTKAEDVLRVYEQLIRVREQIEVIKGRIQYLEGSSRLSLINVQLIPDIAAQPLQIGRWQPEGTVKAAVEALLATLQFIVQALIWIVIFILPIVLIIAFVVWIVTWIIRKLRSRKPKGTETPTE